MQKDDLENLVSHIYAKDVIYIAIKWLLTKFRGYNQGSISFVQIDLLGFWSQNKILNRLSCFKDIWYIWQSVQYILQVYVIWYTKTIIWNTHFSSIMQEFHTVVVMTLITLKWHWSNWHFESQIFYTLFSIFSNARTQRKKKEKTNLLLFHKRQYTKMLVTLSSHNRGCHSQWRWGSRSSINRTHTTYRQWFDWFHSWWCMVRIPTYTIAEVLDDLWIWARCSGDTEL